MLKVYEPTQAVIRLRDHWSLIDSLVGGTEAMRQAGRRYMPMWPGEEDFSYEIRLAIATLYPAFARTVSVMSGKPFAKELVLGEDVPLRLEELSENIDAQGTSLHVFASHVVEKVMSHGFAGVLIDFTRTALPNGTRPRNVAEERLAGARPYWVHVNHNQILGWKDQFDPATGVHRLTQLRIAEEVDYDDGPYNTKMVKRVRVLEPGSWELWEDVNGTDEYVSIDRGTMEPLTEIPFVPFYGKELAFMSGRSPLAELAYLNVKHWQSQSDQDTILHMSRVPIVCIIGGDQEKTLVISSSKTVNLQLGADMKFVEHSGAAIKAGQDSLEALELQMVQTGAELLIQKPGQRTATEDNNDADANKSDLQRIVERIEDSLDRCMQVTAQWLRLPEGGHISLFKDFLAATLSDASAQMIVTMRNAGLISKETALREQQRRGVISPDIDIEAELEKAEADGPALGALGRGETVSGSSPGPSPVPSPVPAAGSGAR